MFCILSFLAALWQWEERRPNTTRSWSYQGWDSPSSPGRVAKQVALSSSWLTTLKTDTISKTIRGSLRRSLWLHQEDSCSLSPYWITTPYSDRILKSIEIIWSPCQELFMQKVWEFWRRPQGIEAITLSPRYLRLSRIWHKTLDTL